jgi:hypothetical protein
VLARSAAQLIWTSGRTACTDPLALRRSPRPLRSTADVPSGPSDAGTRGEPASLLAAVHTRRPPDRPPRGPPFVGSLNCPREVADSSPRTRFPDPALAHTSGQWRACGLATRAARNVQYPRGGAPRQHGRALEAAAPFSPLSGLGPLRTAPRRRCAACPPVNRPGSDGGSGYWIPTPAGSACWAA